MTDTHVRVMLGGMLGVIVGLAALAFAAFFPNLTAYVILGVVVIWAIPQTLKRFKR